MARLTVEEQKEYPTLPPDSIVSLLVDNVEVRTVRGQRGDWEKLEFTFKITGIQHVNGAHPSQFDSLVGEKIYGSTPFRLTDAKENKLRNWAEAILARPLELGFELDTDYFLKREVRGVTSTYEKRAKDANGNPYIGHQIESLLPMGGNTGVIPGQAPGGYAQPQQPVQQAPQGWGAPGVQQQPAPAQDPWSTPQQQPAANDPWAAPQQAPAQAPQQAPAQQPQYAGAQQAFEEEPPF